MKSLLMIYYISVRLKMWNGISDEEAKYIWALAGFKINK